MKLPYIGPIESIFEGPEILKVLSEELKLPALMGLCLEPSYSGRRIEILQNSFSIVCLGSRKKLTNEKIAT